MLEPQLTSQISLDVPHFSVPQSWATNKWSGHSSIMEPTPMGQIILGTHHFTRGVHIATIPGIESQGCVVKKVCFKTYPRNIHMYNRNIPTLYNKRTNW